MVELFPFFVSTIQCFFVFINVNPQNWLILIFSEINTYNTFKIVSVLESLRFIVHNKLIIAIVFENTINVVFTADAVTIYIGLVNHFHQW